MPPGWRASGRWWPGQGRRVSLGPLTTNQDLDPARLRAAFGAFPSGVVAVGNGPVLDVLAQLGELDGLQVLTERDYATACGAWLTAIDESALVHDDEPTLTRSVVGLVTRPAVTDGVAFSRRHSVGDSSPAIAATAAAWWAVHKPATAPPRIYLGREAS